MERKPFEADFGLKILNVLVEHPPSDRMLDTRCLNEIRWFVKTGESDPVAVWNFFKRMLDVFVHGSAAAPFLITTFDIEAFMDGPQGSFCQRDRSIEKAPWRENHSLLLPTR